MTKVLITAKLTGSNAPNLFFDSVLANPESPIPGYLENFLRVRSLGAASNRQPHQMLVRILKGRSADFGLGGARIQSCRVIEGVIAKGCLAAKGDPAKSLPQAFAVLAFF